MTYASPFLLTTPGVVPTSTRGSWEPGHCWGLVWCGGVLLQIALVCWFMLFAPLACFFCLIDMLFEILWPWMIHVHLGFLEDCPGFACVWKWHQGCSHQIFRDRTACFRKLPQYIGSQRTRLCGSECDLIPGYEEPQLFLRHPQVPCAFLQIMFYC